MTASHCTCDCSHINMALLDALPVGIMHYGNNGKCIFFNKKFAQLTGMYICEGSKGNSNNNDPAEWMQNIHPSDLPTVLRQWTEMLSRGAQFKCEIRFSTTIASGNNNNNNNSNNSNNSNNNNNSNLLETSSFYDMIWCSAEVQPISKDDKNNNNNNNGEFTTTTTTTTMAASSTNTRDECFVLTLIDITEQKKTTYEMSKLQQGAETEMEEFQSTIQSFYDTSPLMMGVCELPDGEEDMIHITDNPTTARLYGLTPSEMRNKLCSRIGAPREYIHLWVSHYRMCEKLGMPVSFEYPHIASDGVHWLCATVSQIKRSSSGLPRFSYVVTDITDRKITTQALKESQQRFHLLAKLSPVGIMETDANSQVVFVNERWFELTGCKSLEEATKTRWTDYVCPDDRERIASLWEECVRSRGHFQRHCKFLNRNNNNNNNNGTDHDCEWRFVLVQGSPLLTGEADALPQRQQPVSSLFTVTTAMAKSTATTTTMTTSTTASTTLECGYVTTFTDVTEQMLVEKKIRAANLAKSQFLANMSHEMRTPLNAILGCIQLLQETPILDVQLEYINIMKSSANSLLSLISDVLDLSKIEEGKLQLVPAPFNLLEIVEVVVDIVSSEAASKGLELSYYVPIETPLFLYGDSSRLRQVLLNLLSNAVKFTFHGKIDLRVTILEETSTDISLRISVQDTGIGIPENKQKDLFQRFFQVDTSSTRKFDGSGLGLAISKAIVDLFKGKIVVESTPDHGSLFYIECTFEKDLQHKSNADGAIASPARKRLQHEQTTMQAQQPHSNNAIEISPSHSPLLSSHHRRSSSSEIEFTQLSPALRNAWTNIKIFLLDPNTSIQSLVQSYAKSWGCTCVVASDLQSGLELLERDPSFNVFFISLPNTDQRRTMVSRIKSLSPLLSSSSSSTSSNHNSNSNRLIYLLFLENRDMKNSFDSSDEWRDVKAIVKPLKRSKLYSLLLNFARSLAPAPSSQPHLNDQDDNNNTSSPTSLSTPSPPASVSTRDGNILTSPAARDTTNGTTTGGSSGSGGGGGGKKAFNPANISVLVVDDNNINKKVTTQLLKNSGFQCDVASDGHEAYEKWTKNEYDIILMDLMMPICDGFEATKLIRAQENEMMMMMMRGGHLRTTRAPPSIIEGTAEEADAESQLDGLLSPATTTTTSSSSASIQIDSNSNSNSSANNMTRRHQHPQLQLQHTCSDSTMSSSSTSSSLIMLSPPVTPRSSSSSSTPLLLPQHQRTHTPIIAMTANTLMEELDRCLRAGMDDYITKPCTKKDLVAMIRKWVVQAEEEED